MNYTRASLCCAALLSCILLFCTSTPRYTAANGGKKRPAIKTPSRKSASHSSPPSRATRAGCRQTGIASYYGKKFHGRTTASGERYNMNRLTAAHRSFEFGTRVKVTNLSNDKSVVVTINDRGPYAKGRIIDLSRAAASRIGMLSSGTARVCLKIID